MGRTIATALMDLFPAPVPAKLAGRMFLVGQLRVRDLAAIERLMADLTPHPLADYPRPEDDPDPATRPARLREAYRRSKAWPPAYGSDEAQAIQATASGMAAYLHVVLSEHNALSTAEVVAMLPAISADEWVALDRIAWGVSIREELHRELNPGLHEGERAEPQDWGIVLYEVAASRQLTLGQVGEMYVSEVRLFFAAFSSTGLIAA